jgi:hypothetical protein
MWKLYIFLGGAFRMSVLATNSSECFTKFQPEVLGPASVSVTGSDGVYLPTQILGEYMVSELQQMFYVGGVDELIWYCL